ncbi:dUTP diphosphatase [Helicobacter sp. 11S02596-1]|uniref:dUTP diphosphatase n=1 Tax=Helicobacter sp. 11S02596-1 TaxID=1476194 RepID=UPI000BA6F9CD|nr:dUTP diphosphatase [Helicobacter sp. 11S02596-1]PAF41526.1 deoxyuridine 5'-triphosphate nucleotidohydrolase [Helicobacter sp. 11S02596-1]
MKINIKKTHPDAIIPKYQTEGAAGFDFCALGDYIVPAGGIELVKTGLSMAIEGGYELQIRPRSSLALKHRISVLNTPGTIDSDYRGEIMIILINHADVDFAISAGDRIAQGVISKTHQADFIEVEELDSTPRGAGGFGSSGIK